MKPALALLILWLAITASLFAAVVRYGDCAMADLDGCPAP